MTADTRIFECIPNVSEGRDRDVLDACAAAIESAGASLAHRTSDAVHHRSVFTFFGTHRAVRDAAIALAAITTARIDLRVHRGAHPRIGALDVLPIVPFGSATVEDAISLARDAARAIWETSRVPSVFYGDAATTAKRRLLADLRTGGFEAIAERGHPAGAPDVGDRAVHPRAGAIAVGVRAPLVAFNVLLATGEIEIARAIARDLRERGGGLRSLRCLAIAISDASVQVSCNLTDPSAVDPGLAFDLVRAFAAERGVGVGGGELIGLVPRDALVRVLARDFGIDAAAVASFANAPVEVRPETA